MLFCSRRLCNNLITFRIKCSRFEGKNLSGLCPSDGISLTSTVQIYIQTSAALSVCGILLIFSLVFESFFHLFYCSLTHSYCKKLAVTHLCDTCSAEFCEKIKFVSLLTVSQHSFVHWTSWIQCAYYIICSDQIYLALRPICLMFQGIKSTRIIWVRHVACIGDRRGAFFGKSEWNKPLGRPWC